MQTYKLRGLIALIVWIAIGILLYVILYTLQRDHKWQYVRPLTINERIRVTQLYGPSAALYRYVVVNPLRVSLCNHPVTVNTGFLTDGVTSPLKIDAYGEEEWILHDYLYSTHSADDGYCISKYIADNTMTYADRRIAVLLWGEKKWIEGKQIGPQFLDIH